MGLDHAMVAAALSHWQSVDAAAVAAAATVEGGPAVLSLWRVDATGEQGERRTFVLPIASTPDGRRLPAVERRVADLASWPPGPRLLQLAERRALLQDVLEPMLQRDLEQRGGLAERGGYGARLLGWVEAR